MDATTLCCEHLLRIPYNNKICSPLVPGIFGSFCGKSSLSSSSSMKQSSFCSSSFVCIPKKGLLSKPWTRFRPRAGAGPCETGPEAVEDENEEEGKRLRGTGMSRLVSSSRRSIGAVIDEVIAEGSSAIISACSVGLLTGICVVLFNNAVHEIRDFFWEGIPYRGASWLREEPIEEIWQRVIAVPVCGGLIVSMLNVIRSALEVSTEGTAAHRSKAVLKPVLKAVAACFTLGTGNSLGPEGPSVEIGASVAKGVDSFFNRGSHRKVSLVAAGSAAGISSGFNAAVAGCFFAVESVLWPSPQDSSLSRTNTTSVVILSAVIASVVSEVGLGSEPAFKVPQYDFRSPSELPLYLLLGVLCGLVSVALSRCTSYMMTTIDEIHKTVGIPRVVYPVLGGFFVGLIALAYPEILYWGFENVDILLESQPFVKGLSADLLLQLVGVKIVATSLCRASGLVGGYYAPSLFIGAATGMAYGKFVSVFTSQSNMTFQLSFLEVASPQAYGLVGMAATLAGVCQVPLTSVLLLFELTQDYRIVLPLLGAVGLSSWITSSQTNNKAIRGAYQVRDGSNHRVDKLEMPSSDTSRFRESNLCEIESSLCLDDLIMAGNPLDETKELEKRIYVSQAMRTRFVTVLMSNLLTEAITLMLDEKQNYALIVDNENILIGLLTLGDIQKFSRTAAASNDKFEELLVYKMCSMHKESCQVSWTATPDMRLFSAMMIMDTYSLSQLPVVTEVDGDNRGRLVGVLDGESISLTCSAMATREYLCSYQERKGMSTD
ncbi:Chloride channel, voltage gated [Dillenia turbinata]|uniref:Chloride channel protein n=1 Tax=Dillenia turbinata TaxID=194707 RepID=A0AAN8ZM08_9MAGN